MDMGTLVILKLPKWLVSTDGWGLMLPHNNVPALFKVTAFTVEGCELEEGTEVWSGVMSSCRSEKFEV